MNKKIALVLCRTLGDVMLTHNLVDGIYKKYEDPEVHVFVNEQYGDVVLGNPKIHKVYSSPNWLEHWDAILKMIYGTEYDDVLIPQQLSQEDTRWHQLSHLRHQHLLDYYLSRSRLPKRDETENLQLYISEHDIEAVNRIKTINKLDKYVVIHTTTGVPTKDWDSFPELVHTLMDEGISVFQVGSEKDKDANGRKDHDEIKYFDVREKMTFSQIGALCRNASCFVGLDSGLSYIAAASGTPTIVLQGSTVPETSGPFGDNVVSILSKTLPRCESLRCHTNCRVPSLVNGKCINYITAKEVLGEVRRFTNETVQEKVPAGDKAEKE